MILFVMLVGVAWAGELRQVSEALVDKYYFDGTYNTYHITALFGRSYYWQVGFSQRAYFFVVKGSECCNIIGEV